MNGCIIHELEEMATIVDHFGRLFCKVFTVATIGIPIAGTGARLIIHIVYIALGSLHLPPVGLDHKRLEKTGTTNLGKGAPLAGEGLGRGEHLGLLGALWNVSQHLGAIQDIGVQRYVVTS